MSWNLDPNLNVHWILSLGLEGHPCLLMLKKSHMGILISLEEDIYTIEIIGFSSLKQRGKCNLLPQNKVALP